MKIEVNDKLATVLIAFAAVLIGLSIILFIIYKDNNHFINVLATFLLLIGTLVAIWLKFYSGIEPIWIGILFAVILLIAFIVVSLVIHKLAPNLGSLTGILIIFVLAFLFYYFEKPLCNFLLSIFKR